MLQDILKQPENKDIKNNNHKFENEEKKRIILKPGELLQQSEETQKTIIQHEPVIENTASKLHSYLENLPYAEGQFIFLLMFTQVLRFFFIFIQDSGVLKTQLEKKCILNYF